MQYLIYIAGFISNFISQSETGNRCDVVRRLRRTEQLENDYEETEYNNDITEVEDSIASDIEIGQRIQHDVRELSQKDDRLANYLVEELIHLQDIFSTDDLRSWDVASKCFANENFAKYAGKGHVLIQAPIDEYDFWESQMGGVEDEDEDYDDQGDDEDADY